MKVETILANEGIENATLIDSVISNKIARRISRKLALTFPEHNLKENLLFNELSQIKMYIAQMPEDLSGAKYLWKNNSIYFKKGVKFSVIEEFAMHECLHHIQEILDKNGKLVKMGLYDFANDSEAINEAAVQIMATKAMGNAGDKVKYYDIVLDTISPNYYPLQCSLINQLTYFTGTYSLYHSTLYSDDMFKNIVEQKLGEKSYKIIKNALSVLMQKEIDLNYIVNKNVCETRKNKIEKNNKYIQKCKADIADYFFKIQNYIMSHGFETEIKSVKNLEDLMEFKKHLYRYKDIIASNETYDFYNKFYIQKMEEFQNKKEYIEQFGEIIDGTMDMQNMSLVIVKSKYSFIKRILIKLKILKKYNINEEVLKSLN